MRNWSLAVFVAFVLTVYPVKGKVFSQMDVNARTSDFTSPSKLLADKKITMAIKMMEEVRRRQRELNEREEEIRLKEARLKELERQIELKIGQLEEKQRQLKELEGRIRGFASEKQRKNLLWLAKVYESTPAEQAASRLARLDPEIAAQVLVRMNRRKAGRLWGYLDPKKAAQLTTLLTKIQGQREKREIGNE